MPNPFPRFVSTHQLLFTRARKGKGLGDSSDNSYVTLAHVILRLRVAQEIIGFLSVTNIYIHTQVEKSFLSEMKGDVGMSLYEKEGEQEDA